MKFLHVMGISPCLLVEQTSIAEFYRKILFSHGSMLLERENSYRPLGVEFFFTSFVERGAACLSHQLMSKSCRAVVASRAHVR